MLSAGNSVGDASSGLSVLGGKVVVVGRVDVVVVGRVVVVGGGKSFMHSGRCIFELTTFKNSNASTLFLFIFVRISICQTEELNFNEVILLSSAI